MSSMGLMINRVGYNIKGPKIYRVGHIINVTKDLQS